MSRYYEDWTEEGICRQVAPELWFAELGDSGSVREAKKVCSGCPVKDICLETALQRHERYGVWGGASERERRVMEKARAKPQWLAEQEAEVAA